MTEAQFITAVEAKPIFIKWASDTVVQGQYDGVVHKRRVALISNGDGHVLFNVNYIIDEGTGEAKWQGADTLEPDKNTAATKITALTDYLKANFDAYFLLQGRIDTENNWAEAEVLTVSGQDLTRSKVLVFKKGANPITHRTIV